jgi:4-diphosphocytidyl-2-C-methyl-D-erythritol kinase
MLVTERANAKINLALHVLGRRLDGYHELDSIVAFAGVGDVLTIEPASSLALTLSGPFANDLNEGSENSVLAAWRLLAGFTELAPVKFQLEKNLPIASGIGGGSADAAAALRGLIKLFNLKISAADLNAIALKLGADVPVCLASTPCRMQGIGETLSPIGTQLPKVIVLVNPLLPSPTAKVFETLGLQPGQSFGSAIEDITTINSWRNDLEHPAIQLLPEIAQVIAALKSQAGITTARMSGSGATCFGLCENLEAAEAAASAIKSRHIDWWVVATRLAGSAEPASA